MRNLPHILQLGAFHFGIYPLICVVVVVRSDAAAAVVVVVVDIVFLHVTL